MEYFIDQLQIALPVLGVQVLRGTHQAERRPPDSRESASPVFYFKVPKAGISARAQQIDGEFTVLQGSRVAAEVRASDAYAASTAAAYTAYRALHQRLVEDGSIRVDGGSAVLTRDVVFSSPSTAGAVVSGRSCNGREAWKTEAGQTFGTWEERGVGPAAVAPER